MKVKAGATRSGINAPSRGIIISGLVSVQAYNMVNTCRVRFVRYNLDEFLRLASTFDCDIRDERWRLDTRVSFKRTITRRSKLMSC
jgi:hypothetical protein